MRVDHRLRVARYSLAMALVVAASLTALALQSASAKDSPLRSSQQESRAAVLRRLPSDFVGCWRGTIQGDDFKPAFPGNTMSKDPTTYELCYGPVREGSYRLNLLKLVMGLAVVRPDRFESQVLSADDQAGSAKIRNHLVLTQTRYILWTLPVRFHVDVDAVEDCRLVSHDVISMRGTQLIAVDEKIYGQQTFHADFRRVFSDGTPSGE
jgi:hypothetical protein